MAQFIIDHDVEFARQWFPGTVADGRLSDPEIVAIAFDDGVTPVTANGGDFVREMLAHHKRHPCTKRLCHDMNGLIVIPNKMFRAQNAVEKAKKSRWFLRAGDAIFHLDDVHRYNLYLKFHAGGTVELKRFPICQYRDDGLSPEWYYALKIVGRG